MSGRLAALLKAAARRTPGVRALARRVREQMQRTEKVEVERFPGTENYWERRYASGGGSGVGSYGQFAAFKAEVINGFVRENAIASVIEFGCGDGNQLALARYPSYIGFDISPTVVERCRESFRADPTKRFLRVQDYAGETAELVLSLDVIYHLVEDSIFEEYMNRLFGAATRFVIVYSSNTDQNEIRENTYIRHRKFTDWVARQLNEWTLFRHLPNRFPYRGDYRTGSFSDFYFFRRGE